MSKYLLEVGCEELPYKFIPSAIQQLKTGFENFLNSNKVVFEKVDVYATPRRLAVIVSGLEKQSKDEEKIVKGPIKKVAYDENGNLTRAGEGFCKKNGISPEDLYIENDYIHAKIVIKGKSIVELLKDNVPAIVLKLQGSHFMRWAENEVKFSRPIRWIVSILDNEEVKIKIIDRESSNVTRGHRFAEEKEAVITSPDDYIEILRKHNVIVNQDERKQLIIERAKEEAAKLGAEPYYTDDLLEEVTFITEYPVPAVCEFSTEYLKLPEELVVTVMAVHQRYFALYKDGKLINRFITMTNYIGDNFENIAAGNVRVIKARLDDAVFFFNEDTKKPLVDYVEALKGVTFQKGMGSMFDKTQRLIKLSNDIAKDLNVDSKDVERTALLCKADLTTNLVFEFTELQGFIGADYARVSGEDAKVVQGIKEHYFPLNAESETAKGIEGQIVGIADKIDTVCAVFAAGKKPTGSSDPLGVRRAALGVIRTILDGNLKIDVDKYIKDALKALPVQRDCANEINEFFVQRMIIFLADKYNKNILEACSMKNPLTDIADYVERVKVVNELNCPQLVENANRVIRILKDNSENSINESFFKEQAEKDLYTAIKTVSETNDYKMYLKELETLNPVVTKFFDDVLVMDKDENVKKNRLSLLTLLKKKYEHLTDFSKV
ncbi:MAG: glycine--tRNA ligase subunit beta [Candidatus Melainabacteria bacterium]|nr:MAG: glycine--tRNA ligase subunit beta [Candidatus Melainabacteria bacterium]